jgi:hypothetical protein
VPWHARERRDVVDAGDVAVAACGGEACVAVAARDVEHRRSGAQVRRLAQLLADDLQRRPDHSSIQRFPCLHPGGSAREMHCSSHQEASAMYMCVRKYRNVKADNRQQLMDKTTNGFVPLLAKIDGFVDYYCMFTEDGSVLSVSVFRDKRGADESVSVAAKWTSQNLAGEFPEKAEVEGGEVFTQRHAAAKKAA